MRQSAWSLWRLLRSPCELWIVSRESHSRFPPLGLRKQPAGLLHVVRDLGFQLLDAQEPLFGTQALDEGDVDGLAVEVAVVIEEVRLDLALAPVEGGCHADVGAGRVSFVTRHDVPRVDAQSGDEYAGVGKDVGGGKTDGAATPVPDDDLAAKGERPAEQLRRLA